MIGTLIKAIAGPLLDKTVDGIVDVAKQFINKEITKEELRTRLAETLIKGTAEIEKAHADSIAATFDSFMKAAVQSKIMLAVWAATATSQLLVILWHQVGIPLYSHLYSVTYPSSGDTSGWAYALLMFCLGGGAIALRTGPAKMPDLTKVLR
jgi:hypothetical protein